MPSIEGGGLEKNLYIISNFLAKKISKISLITVSRNEKYRFNKRIDFIAPKQIFWNGIWKPFGRQLESLRKVMISSTV